MFRHVIGNFEVLRGVLRAPPNAVTATRKDGIKLQSPVFFLNNFMAKHKTWKNLASQKTLRKRIREEK